MSSYDDRRARLSTEARHALDELLAQRADDVVAAAQRGARGQVDEIDILRAYYETSPEHSVPVGGLPLDVERRIAHAERRISSLFLLSFSLLLIPTLVTAVIALLSFAQDTGGVAEWSGWVPLVAGLLGAVSLVLGGIWVVTIYSQRSARRSAEMFDRYARDVTMQASVDYNRLRDPFDAEDIEIAESEEAAIRRYSFMSQWMDVERRLHELAEVAMGGTATNRPISGVVQSLVHEGIISRDTEFLIKRLLLSRNEIVHREQPRMDWARNSRDIREVESSLAQALREAQRRGSSPR